MIGIEVVFRCRLSWCNGSHAGPGGDDERTVGTGERGSHRLNGFPVGFAVCDKLREVVVEGVWMTPSDMAAPRCRLSRSSRSPRNTSAPAAIRDWAPASDRLSPST